MRTSLVHIINIDHTITLSRFFNAFNIWNYINKILNIKNKFINMSDIQKEH